MRRAGPLLILLTAVPLAGQVERLDSARSPLAEPRARERYTASIEHSHVHFMGRDGSMLPWRLTSAELLSRSRPLTLVGRVNHAERFGLRGTQLEVDAYPRLLQKLYGYFNIGFSGAEIFPGRRFGAELFTELPSAMEASLGLRRLEFTSSRVDIITGSLGKYSGNYYFSARPYLVPEDGRAAMSGILMGRRYFSSEHSYATLQLGAGRVPTDALAEDELNRASSRHVVAYGKMPVRRRFGVRWSLAGEHEEITADRERSRFTLGIGGEVRF